jgi:hypothetical protein
VQDGTKKRESESETSFVGCRTKDDEQNHGAGQSSQESKSPLKIAVGQESYANGLQPMKRTAALFVAVRFLQEAGFDVTFRQTLGWWDVTKRGYWR